ncbi:ketopantoate reductase C-terminal domain-containing protein [Pseudomonas sp. RT4P38]
MELLAEKFGKDRLLGCACKVATSLDDNGRIVQQGTFNDIAYGELDGTDSDRVANVHEFMLDAGFDAKTSNTISRDMWEKWTLLAAMGSINCLMRGSIGDVVSVKGGREFANAVIDEVVTIIQAVGHQLSKPFLTEARRLLTLEGSMSIPGAVSPVMIDVEVDGKQFQEMHVDGGVITQVFLYPPTTITELSKSTGSPLRRDRNFYVISNGTLDPQWSGTKRRTLNIGGRAISTLIQTQGISDLERIYRMAQQDEADFNLAYIGSDFNFPHGQNFDGDYIRSLFDYAYQLAAQGYPWQKSPCSEKTHYKIPNE